MCIFRTFSDKYYFKANLIFFPPSLSFAPENQRLKILANSFILISGYLVVSTSEIKKNKKSTKY